jgi:hypothetical protein
MATEKEEREALIEAVVSAWRPSSATGELRGHPAWYDLDEAGRSEAFRQTKLARRLEAAIDPEGVSTTVRAVLRRILGT